MSEYIEFDVEITDDPLVGVIETNVTLVVDGAEVYESAEALEEGTPVAQALAVVPGIRHLIIETHTLTVTREENAEWFAIVEDIAAVLRDFFL